MFAKILKLEIRETWALSLGALLIAVLCCAAGTLVVLTGMGVFIGLGFLLSFLASAGLPLALFIWMAWRYYQTMHGRRAYFTHGLPAGGGVILGAKSLWFFLVTMVGIAVAVAGMCTIPVTVGALEAAGGESYAMRLQAFHDIAAAAIHLTPGNVAIGIALLVFSAAQAVVTMTTVSVLANSRRFSTLGAAGAFVISAVILWIAYQVISTVMLLAVPVAITEVPAPTAADPGATKWQLVVESMITAMQSDVTSVGVNTSPNNMFPLGMLIMPVLVIVMYVYSHRQITRSLNLR